MGYETKYLESLLHKRLYWVQVIAALKYEFKPIEDKRREMQIFLRVEEQCLKENYSQKLTNVFLGFFKFNISLAKYVQKVCFSHWSTLSELEFLVIRQKINKMLKKDTQEKVDFLQVARKKIDDIDQRIFEEMHKFTLIAFRGFYEKS